MSARLAELMQQDAVAAVRKPLAHASLLPPVVYSSEDIFRLEREMLAHQWLPVCHVSQLPEPGSYVARTLAGEPVLALRDKQGAIQVYSNVCRHRNMALTSGEGQCKGGRFSCPYHGWTYGLDGRLLAAPFMDQTEGFDKKDFSLPKVRSEIWAGFVFVNFDESAPALTPRLASLDKYAGRFNLGDAVALPLRQAHGDWNWKLSIENFTEAYHQPWVHPTTAEPSAPATGAIYYDNDDPIWSVFLIPHVGEFAEAFPAPPTRPGDVEMANGAVIFNIYPYFHALATHHMTLWLDLEIDGVNSHKLIWRALFHPAPGVDLNQEIEGLKKFLGPVLDEDIGICQGVGVGSHARLARPGRLSYMEKAVHQFHNWWLDAVGG